MGGSNSKLDCMSKKSKERKKQIEKNRKGLSDNIIGHRDAVDGLQSKATKLVSRVSTRDRALVEGRLGDSEKKFGDITDQVEKTKRQYDIIDANLDDIKEEVDQYLEWLKDKEEQLTRETPRGYSVKEAEAKLAQNNDLRKELEEKRGTLERVKQKSDGLVQDLSRVERNMVERWVARLSTENQKVMEIVESQNKLLVEQAGEQAIFQESLEKVNHWLHDKDQEVQKLKHIRLTSSDVDKQIEKSKTLHSEVLAHNPHVENLRKLVEPLLVDCSPELAAELKQKLSDVQERYESLLNSAKQENGNLRDHVAARKLFEADVHKVDRWCKDTEISCSTEPNLECAIEVLQEQCKHYRNLENTSQLFASLVKEIEDRGATFLPTIYDADKVKLEGTMKSTKEKYNRVAALVKDRVESTETALQSRSQVHESLTEVTDWLQNIQDEIKQLQGTPVGSTTEDANQLMEKYEDIGEKIANYQPSIAQLNQAVERLRSNGQNMEADEILQLTSQYEMALDKVEQESMKCKQAVAFRQNYTTQKAQLEAAVHECEDELNEVAQSGMPITERIQKFKAITDKLQSTEPLFMVVSDKAHELSVASGEDARPITDSIQNIKSHIDQLKKQADKKTKQCDRIQKSRTDFDNSIDEAIVWLEQKEDILASCTAQEMEPDKLMVSLQKHNALAREALDKIAAVKDKSQLEKAHYEKLGEPIPATMEDKLNQIKSLEDSIKEAIAKKENYLEEAKTDRMQFEMSMKQINDWISGAEEMLDSGYEGTDYDTLTDTISEHKDYFSEASMCQDEMEQVMEISERLLPTLDNNDKETLRQTLKNTNKKLSDVMAASQRRQQTLEKRADDWQEYKDMVFNVTEQLQDLEEQWSACEQLPVATPAMVQQQLATSKGFLSKIEDVRSSISDINDRSRDLEKDGNSVSRSFISRLADDLNDRYNTLTTTTENKQMTLQNLKGQWDEYTTLLEDVENLVNTAEHSLPTIEVETAHNHELLTNLNDTKQICTQIQVSEPKIEALKRCTENLQRNLPTAEAKIHTQEKLMNLLEKLERVQDNANEYHIALQEEIDDRGSFQTEADQTVQWLNEAKMELERLDPGREVSDVVERIEKQKVLQQEVAIRMDQMEHAAQLQKAKYSALGKDLPEDLEKQIIDMKDLETDVATVMKVKGQELQNIKADREEVTSSLKDVSLWLTDAELRLQDRIINVPDSLHHLQVLQSEFDDFKPVLDKLRKRGSDLIQHTPDTIEKQLVQKALADTNRQWLALQGKAAEKTRKLEEAKDLIQNFDEIANPLEKWLNNAESAIKQDDTWTNFDTVRDQLKQQRKLAKDLDNQQDKLSNLATISKRLEPICDAAGARDKLSKLNKRMFNLHSKASEKLNTLEEITDDIDDYEDELTRLRLWMDETKSHLTMRDTTLTLKEQLAIQEKILEDIESHKGKALLVEQKQSELKNISGKEEPAGGLSSELSELHQMAREQCETLQESMVQQEQYESDVRHLSSAITEAQDKLLNAPVQASNVNTLKKQIAEHNALASQIKSYQDKIYDINEKSKHLTDRSLGMRPAMIEKLSQMGYRYPSSLPSLKVSVGGLNDRSGPDSGIFVSPESSFNMTQRSVSDADFSSSTLPSGKTGHSSGRQHDPGSISGRSDDTDITMENYPGLFDQYDSQTQKRSRGHGQPQRSRSPSPYLSEERIIKKQHEPVQMSSVSQPRSAGSMGQSLHRNVASQSLQPFSEMEVSASVPNLLEPQLMVPRRERSASFGAKLKPKFDDIALLNTSWNTLQQQLGAREHELQVALQKQERYQQSVQDVTLKMERTQSKLARTYPSSLVDLDRQLKDYRESLTDIDSIREDIARVRERGRQIVEMSDPEGYNTMQATLSMLTDRVDNLQALADTKGKQLQNAVKDKEKHDISLSAYKKHLGDLEEWLEEMKIRQAATPLPTDSVQSLRQYLYDNQTLQEELNNRLQLVSDLAVQCDALCEQETPANAEKLRSQLTNLQTQLGNLKLAAIEKQGPIRAAIKESEKRQKEMDDYEMKVKKLQDWVSDTKQIAMVPPKIETLILPEDHQSLQQQLRSELSEHRQLVQQLSTDAPSYQTRELEVSTVPPISEEELVQRWQELNEELNQKKEQLEDLLRGSRSWEPRGQGYSWLSPTDTQGQLKDIRHNLDELNNLWQQLTTQVVDKQLRLDQALDYQQKYQDALQNISQWLDLAEQKIMSPDGDKDSQQQLRENEALQRDIKSLQNEITAMARNSQDLLTSTNRESQELVTCSLGNLNERVQLLENQAQRQGEKLRHADRKWKEYRDEVQSLQRKLAEIRSSMATQSPTASLDELVSHMQKMETQLKTCEGQLRDLRYKGEEISVVAPKMINPTEIKALQTNYMELQQKVMDKKADLLQSVSVQDQYEKLLADYAEFLETANEKLKTETTNVKDLHQLKQQLASHKEFFSDLEVNRAMLDTLSQQCDKNTQQSHLSQHTRLNNLTYVILDKASLQGQRLERMVRQWLELSEKYDQLQGFLNDIERQMPRPVANDDSIMAIQEKINTYHRLQRELTDEKPTVFQVVDKGKQLLHSLNCPGLETEVTDLAEKWVSLNTKLSLELKRTEKLGEQLQAFEAEAAVLRTWLLTAKMKLTDIKHLSEKDQQSIATIRSKNDKLLEFRKEVENQEGLRNKIMFVGKQLSENQTYDTAALERNMTWLEEQWGLLEHDINKAEEYLHQAQMDLMPSRQALTELATWLNEMENAVRQEKSKTVKNMADIEISLKKFKDFKIEVQNKQLTIDFVNQSSLQTGTQDHESIPYMSSDKTEFAERLGTLNKRWQSLSHDVNEQLRTFEMLQKKWEEYESSLSRLQDWFQEQEDKIKQYRLIGHEVSVKQTLKECKMLQQTLKAKEEEIDQARSLGERLVELSHDSPGCQRSIQHSLDNLNKRWQHLYDQVQDLRSILNELLSQWEAYHKELQGVNQVLSETEYCLSRYTNVGADLITLRMQVEKLKGLQSDVDKNTHKYDRCLALGSQLMQVCETPAKQDIQKTMADVQGRWQKMCVDLHDRLSMFEVCLTQWQQYEHEYNKARRWLDAKERLCNELVAIREDTNRRDECLQESKALQRDLDDFQSQLSSLYHLSDSVTKNMDTPSITNLTSRLSSLDQRVMALRQILSKQVQMLQGDLSQRQRFKVLFDSVSAFVNRAAKTLSETEPSKTSETPVLQSRYEKLKVLTTEFADNMTELDSLNDLGYRLALDETSAINLRELNHKWHELYSDAKEHSKDVQGALLVQQDFTGKCDTWMTFLAETEQDLSMEIGGSLPELINQLRKCEKFESDMYSKQQILHAIISDGQKMMKDGEVENRTEFQNKLHLLAEQWQSVVRRANQRKAIIEASIKQWRDFNDLTEKLRDWLADKEYGMTAFDVDSVSLQKVKNLLEKAQNMQNEFKLQEESLKQINAQAQPLLQKGDDKAKEHIKVSTAQLEQHWHHLNTRLEEQCKHLEGVLKQWQECEGEIEDISSWLKDTRLTLTAELPTAYDKLQAELNKCKEIEAEFAGNEPRKEALLEKENKLGEIIQPEDLNVLHQRIRLLNKQWEELRNQAVLRQQKITDNMCRWAGFNDRVKEMLDWMEKMELKVISSQEYHIEDLLHKLQQKVKERHSVEKKRVDYRDEMAEKERTKTELISQGHQLAKVSSEVRAADIESKLQRLEDKWLHVTSVMAFRQRKLQETLLAVQQLDISMANLRKWLAGIEHDLSTPVIYQECSLLEIQHKLQIQQKIQKDIEHHSAGVGSVLNLCEVLLHDTDACPSEKEFDALENAMKSLDKRWRNICILSPEMRSSIEETWGLWQTLLDDSKMFCNWLDNKERDVSDLCLDTPSIGPTREEVAQFEIIQKEIHDNLSQLEDINKQYRKLAREGRTDHSGILKQKMQDANDRWDKLQQYVSSIMRKLKHSANLREDFNHTRNMMYNWLTDMQVQLTNIQLLSSMDPETKLREIERLQDEINSKSRKMDYLDQSAVYLIQKGDSKDAVKIQRELDDFKQFYSQVINQVNGYHSELEHVVNKHEDDIARAESQLPGDELDELERQLKAGKWDMTELEEYLEASPPESPPEKRRHIQERSVSPVLQLRSTSPVRSRTPPSRSRSPTRSRSRSPSHYASRSPVRSPARIPTRRSRSPMRSREAAEISRQERWRRLREELSLKGREAEIEALLENLVDAIQDAKDKLCEAEEEVYADTRSDTGTDDSFEDYFQCIRECEMSIDNMKRIERLVKTETGVYGIASADVEIKDVLQRWELLQARMMDRDYKMREHRQDWSQFKADLEHMLAWLNEIEALHREQTSGTRDITELDSIIRHHKDFLIQLESKKARVLSINLTSKNFIHPGTQEGRELRDKLRQMNRRWEAVCERANNMQKDLKMSLMHCEEFHHTIHDLLLWLEKVETKVQQCEPINRGPDDGALWTKLRKLKELKIDMETNQPRVQSLKETADQLLMNDDSTEMVNAKDKTHIISNRLRALIRLCKSYIVCLEERLNVSPESVSSPLSLDLTDSRLSPASYSARTSTPRLRYTQLRPGSSVRTRSPFAVTRQLLRYVRPFWQGTCQDDNTSTELHDVESQTRPSYFRRIVRTAIPLQILLLVLLGIASLVPMTEEDYSCVLMNNFRRSLGPMLRYNNGPPPM